MAKATKYFAIDPNGVEHTRSSARTYSHTVFFQRSKAAALADVNSPATIKQDRKNGQWYLDCIANGRHESLMHFDHYAKNLDEQARDVARAKEKMAGYADAADYAEKLRLEAVAHIEAADWTKWYNAGWAGRLDLAHKVAAQYPGAVIVAVQTK